jgi:hypothetical protein
MFGCVRTSAITTFATALPLCLMSLCHGGIRIIFLKTAAAPIYEGILEQA